MTRNPTRADYLTRALNLVGAPYLWGGRSTLGVDCSGLVTVALAMAGGPDLRRTHNSDALWTQLSATDESLPGDLAFYGGVGNDVGHVAVLVAQLGGAWTVLSASGGGPSVTTTEKARAIGAQVRVHSTHLYRRDFRGFRSVATLLAEVAR